MLLLGKQHGGQVEEKKKIALPLCLYNTGKALAPRLSSVERGLEEVEGPGTGFRRGPSKFCASEFIIAGKFDRSRSVEYCNLRIK